MKGCGMRTTISIISLALALGGTTGLSAKVRRAQPSIRTIVIYTGVVDARSAERLTNIVSANTDKIIGLKLTVATSSDRDDRYYSSLDGEQLNITAGNPTDAPVEVIINDGVGTTAAGAFYTADGFYLIKSGGSHAAGALSFGAQIVKESSIRLNPRIRLITKPF